MLSKCCTLVYSSGNDEFLVTKFCQLIVNLFAKQKVCTCNAPINVKPAEGDWVGCIGQGFDIFQKIAVKFPTPGQKCEVKYN